MTAVLIAALSCSVEIVSFSRGTALVPLEIHLRVGR